MQLKSPKSQSGLTTPKKSDGMESDSDTTPRRSSKRNNNNNNGSAVVKTMSLSLKKSRKLESGTPRKSKSETSTPVQKESSVNKKQTRSKSLSPVRTKVFYKINMRKNAKNKVDSRKKKRKCEVCNKSISVLENFEKHMLNHSIVVRLPRRSLPKTTSASEFVSDESEEQQKIDDVSEIGRRRFTKNSDGGKKSDLQKRNKNKTVVDVEEISTERRRSGRNLDKSKDEDSQKKGEPSPGHLRSRDARLQKTKSATEERFKMKQKTTKKNVKGTPRCSSKRQKTLEIRDESDEESEKASEIETQEPTESTCATCSETFTRLYEYKKHLLGHEKDQSHIAVHLINYKLPQGVKASKFALLQQDKFTARSSPSQSTIDRLLEKYIGEENQKGLNSDADAEKEESEEQEKMDVTAEEEVVNEKKVDEAPENQENGVDTEAEKEEVQEVPSAEDEQITAASENLETTTAVVHEQEAEPAKSPDENIEATQESQTEEITDVSMTEVEAEKAETVDTSNEKRTEIGSESTENVLVISDSDSEVNEVFSQASEATIILDNNDENEEQLEDVIAVDEEKTAEEETVTEEQQEAKNEEEIQSASKTEDTSEENANGDDDIIDSSFNYSEASASPQQQTQESEVSEIVESTPEEGTDNKTEDPVKEILETENEDAPHESTYKTAELTEDISAISDFIRDNFQDKRKRDDEEPSSSPLQVKKKVRFNLDVEESLEENNDFSLVLPSN